MTTTSPAYIFRISPADHCIVEWRRNKVGASWLYWCSRPTEEEALAALLAIQQAGLTIESPPAPAAPKGLPGDEPIRERQEAQS